MASSSMKFLHVKVVDVTDTHVVMNNAARLQKYGLVIDYRQSSNGVQILYIAQNEQTFPRIQEQLYKNVRNQLMFWLKERVDYCYQGLSFLVSWL